MWTAWTLLVVRPLPASGEPEPTFPFAVETVISGLVSPTVVRFADDGQIFVAEKSGLVKRWRSLADEAPETVLDLSEAVNSSGDRGLLGMALHPDFPDPPRLFLLYTYDAPPGQSAPVWNDQCPTPPGALVDGCVVSGRLSAFEMDAEGHAGSEDVLVADAWCQQSMSHSVGALAFDSSGALLVSAGDGAFFRSGVDYGQYGGTLPDTPTPRNPCGDPTGDGQVAQAEGGALRSQDFLTGADPLGFSGAVLRLDPDTGDPMADNPLAGGDARDDALIAYGLRNPFRLAASPRTGDVFIGDVGWRAFEEINRLPMVPASPVHNFGWPCYEGPSRQAEYEPLGLDLCAALYAEPLAAEPPFFSYHRSGQLDPTRCGPAGAAISGLAIYGGGGFPSHYEDALFFADAIKGCVWAMLADGDGHPDPAKIVMVLSSAGFPVDLVPGPEGDLFYVDVLAGTVNRLFMSPSAIFGDGFESGDVRAWSGAL